MTALDVRRTAQRKERLLEQFGAELTRLVQPSIPRVDYEKLRRCVQNLKERERTVVVMTFYDEQTSSDLAGCLPAIGWPCWRNRTKKPSRSTFSTATGVARASAR